ncbi:helix-turn-helix transcriptional regulator [Microbacterium schleiferi]|uniref:helix-turn-helix domain-containing protein n=1 Tax=Microbacterium schleiferi TaxID=69362 RepID=UPI00311D3B5A
MTGGEGTSDFAAEVDQNIARNVRRSRELRGWSQSEFAERMSALGIPGMHQTTIARIESGQRPLRAAEAVALCRLLEVSLERLAESGASADLRSQINELTQSVAVFEAAARQLLHSRRVAALRQDTEYPYDAQGRAEQDQVIRSGVDPNLYETLEERIVTSAPHNRLEVIYVNELHDENAYARPEASKHMSRLEFIAGEMDEWLSRGSARGVLRTIGDDFEDLLSSMNPAEDDGEHQAEE